MKAIINDSWSDEYFDKEFEMVDPWGFFTSNYERKKYMRQLLLIQDRKPSPKRVLEVGCAEGAHTIMIAQKFPKAKIFGVDISHNAIQRARKNAENDCIKFINADIIDYFSSIEDEYFDIIIWSESIYYIGDRLSVRGMYELFEKLTKKLNQGGILCTANIVDQTNAPETPLTKGAIINCYFLLLSNFLSNIHKSDYLERKLINGQGSYMYYKYQIWLFKKL